MNLNFNKMIEESHKQQYFNRYINIICKIFNVRYINAFELYGVNTPYDLQINGNTNIEIKIQRRFALEQYTDDDKKIPGYIFNLINNDVDFVFFFFPNKNEYFCLYASKLLDWWLQNHKKFELIRNKKSNNNGTTWTSSFSYVGRGLIPNDLIYKTNIKLINKNGWTNIDDWM